MRRYSLIWCCVVMVAAGEGVLALGMEDVAGSAAMAEGCPVSISMAT